MGGDFTARNAESAVIIWTGYFELWTDLEMTGRSLLMFPCLLAVWTLVLAFWALVGEVVLKILFHNLSNVAANLTFVSAHHKCVATGYSVCLEVP